MDATTISIGLGGRGLKDKDFFGKSDPYITISKPDTSGGFTLIRTSETKEVRKISKVNATFTFFKISH